MTLNVYLLLGTLSELLGLLFYFVTSKFVFKEEVYGNVFAYIKFEVCFQNKKR